VNASRNSAIELRAVTRMTRRTASTCSPDSRIAADPTRIANAITPTSGQPRSSDVLFNPPPRF